MSINDKACWVAYVQYASCVLKGKHCVLKSEHCDAIFKKDFINKGCTQDNIKNHNIANFSTANLSFSDDLLYCRSSVMLHIKDARVLGKQMK